jgi:hypothetical protein
VLICFVEGVSFNYSYSSPRDFLRKKLMYDRINVPFEFEYPDEDLCPLQGVLTADEINNPNNKTLEGDRIRRVIKRGFATCTTVDTLSSFMSHVRQYFPAGNLDSVDVTPPCYLSSPRLRRFVFTNPD